jgi:hypothetical protein
MKFRPKTIGVVDAVLWTGTNLQEICDFIALDSPVTLRTLPTDLGRVVIGSDDTGDRCVNFNFCLDPPVVSIRMSNSDWTHIEVWTSTEVGGYVVRLSGKCIAWDKEIFEWSFEAVT